MGQMTGVRGWVRATLPFGPAVHLVARPRDITGPN